MMRQLSQWHLDLMMKRNLVIPRKKELETLFSDCLQCLRLKMLTSIQKSLIQSKQFLWFDLFSILKMIKGMAAHLYV